MRAIEKIRRVLSSGVLLEDLTVVPSRGATESEISDEEHALGVGLSEDHKSFLRVWDGINLDVITLMGCGGTDSEIPRLRDSQHLGALVNVKGVVFGFDPAGFSYVEAENGEIVCLDSDGGEVEIVASGFDDFLSRYVFGNDADRFSHDEWKDELREANLLDDAG